MYTKPPTTCSTDGEHPPCKSFAKRVEALKNDAERGVKTLKNDVEKGAKEVETVVEKGVKEVAALGKEAWHKVEKSKFVQNLKKDAEKFGDKIRHGFHHAEQAIADKVAEERQKKENHFANLANSEYVP